MKELVVISGKGGTGKTSIVASFAALAQNAVLADCDVDAADLHLVLDPTIETRTDFSGGSRAWINPELCVGCGKCLELCRYGAISRSGQKAEDGGEKCRVDPISCEGCGVCAWFCPHKAIEFSPAINGQWYQSQTRFGPLIHAKLGVAEENSGKLVTLVRREAARVAQDKAADLIIVDGSPGIGCPVIASITGADLILIVTEPTLSGLHDLERVGQLTRHFGIDTLVCVNKWDLNPEITDEIEEKSRQGGLIMAGKVKYDRAVTQAQIKKQALVEYSDNGAAREISQLWEKVRETLGVSG